MCLLILVIGAVKQTSTGAWKESFEILSNGYFVSHACAAVLQAFSALAGRLANKLLHTSRKHKRRNGPEAAHFHHQHQQGKTAGQ
jgi:hypothetical protein